MPSCSNCHSLKGAPRRRPPGQARDEFDRAILAACEDPYGATEPYGIDDAVTRSLAVAQTVAVLLISQAPRTSGRILHHAPHTRG